MRDYDGEALKYLRAKFPETDEKVFHTDYTGCEYEYIDSVRMILPRLGVDNHFGMFKVVYSPKCLEVSDNGKLSA